MKIKKKISLKKKYLPKTALKKKKKIKKQRKKMMEIPKLFIMMKLPIKEIIKLIILKVKKNGKYSSQGDDKENAEEGGSVQNC